MPKMMPQNDGGRKRKVTDRVEALAQLAAGDQKPYRVGSDFLRHRLCRATFDLVVAKGFAFRFGLAKTEQLDRSQRCLFP